MSTKYRQCRSQKKQITRRVSLPTYTDNRALLAFVRRTPCCSNRSISPARRAHSSKPAVADLLLWAQRTRDSDRLGPYWETDERPDGRPFQRPWSEYCRQCKKTKLIIANTMSWHGPVDIKSRQNPNKAWILMVSKPLYKVRDPG